MTATLYALIIMIIIQCVIIGINYGSFSGLLSKIFMIWLNVLRNNSYSGIIALGMGFVIISGGIDISVGSLMCACGAALMYMLDPVGGILAAMGITGVPAYIIAITVTVICGFMMGELNGFLSANLKIPPFIATLGTMKIFRSVTQQLTQKFNPEVPEGFKQIASVKVSGQVILPIAYWLILVAVMQFIFKKTVFGRNIVAIGSNERAAKYSGININAVKRRIYAICGIMCAIAAIIYVSRIGSMDFSSAGLGYEMDAIAAVVVGGIAMSGGKGNIIGVFLGMLIISIMNNILNSIGVPTFLCEAVRGAIIILAILIQLRQTD